MLENLNRVDKLILEYLVSVRGGTTLKVMRATSTTRTYAFHRLQTLHGRGFILQDIKGKTASWYINPPLRNEVAESIGMTKKDLKIKIKELDKIDQDQIKADKAERKARAAELFGWENKTK